MAVPKSTVPSAVAASAYLNASVDIGSVAANTTLDVEVNAPKNFKAGRPVLFDHASALNAGLCVTEAQCLFVSGVKKIRFRVQNTTAGALDPAAQVFQFWQL